MTDLETKSSSLIIPNVIKIGTKLKDVSAFCLQRVSAHMYQYIFVTESQERDSIFQMILLHWKRAIISRSHGTGLVTTLDDISSRLSAIKEGLERSEERRVGKEC